MKDYIPLFVLVPVIILALFFIWRSRNNDRLVIEGEEKPKDSVKAEKKPSWWAGFLWQTFIARIVVQVVLNGLAFHYNWLGIWTKLNQDGTSHPVTSLVIVNAMLVLAAFLVSCPKDAKSKDLPPAHKAAKWITRIAVAIVVVFLWSAAAVHITKPIVYSPAKLTCKAGEWSAPYTIKTTNIHSDTSEDVYWVRVNRDPGMEYKAEPGKSLQIPPYPRVHTVEWKCDKPMEVTITEKP